MDGARISSPDLPAGVLLDSGTTLMYLPSNITASIYSKVQAKLDRTTRTPTAYVPCALANQDKTIDFTFSGIKISVPYNELVLRSRRTAGSSPRFEDGTPACVFGISSSEGGVSVLGDTFLRSAYVVYDLANNKISLAQTNFNSTTDSIKEIQVGPDGVPDATMVVDPITDARDFASGAARLAAVAAPIGMVVSGASTLATMPATGCLTLAVLLTVGLTA